MLFNYLMCLNNIFVVGLIGLVPAHLPRSHSYDSLHYAQLRTPRLPLLCFQSTRFLYTDISQGSVATPLSCDGICNDKFIANFLLSVTVKEF